MSVPVLDLVRRREHAGFRLSRIAEDAGVDYARLWRAVRGGGTFLHKSEEDNLRRALDPAWPRDRDSDDAAAV